MMVSIIPNLYIHLCIYIYIDRSIVPHQRSQWCGTLTHKLHIFDDHFDRALCAFFIFFFSFYYSNESECVRTKFRKYSDKFHNHRKFSVQSVASNYIITRDVLRTLLESNQLARDFINICDFFNLS